MPCIFPRSRRSGADSHIPETARSGRDPPTETQSSVDGRSPNCKGSRFRALVRTDTPCLGQRVLRAPPGHRIDGPVPCGHSRIVHRNSRVRIRGNRDRRSPGSPVARDTVGGLALASDSTWLSVESREPGWPASALEPDLRSPGRIVEKGTWIGDPAAGPGAGGRRHQAMTDNACSRVRSIPPDVDGGIHRPATVRRPGRL